MAGVDRLLSGDEPSTPVWEVETRVERLEQRVDDLERRQPPTPRGPAPAAGYTLFFRGSGGYEIVDRDGVAPPVGTPIVVAGKRLVVEGMRRSPFPSDDRPCLVLAEHVEPQ